MVDQATQTPSAEHSISVKPDSDGRLLAEVLERVERLLVRYEELQRTNALLHQELGALTAERDSLRSRLAAARARVDALIDRLPEPATTATSH